MNTRLLVSTKLASEATYELMTTRRKGNYLRNKLRVRNGRESPVTDDRNRPVASVLSDVTKLRHWEKLRD
jgi:hypothetical protein